MGPAPQGARDHGPRPPGRSRPRAPPPGPRARRLRWARADRRPLEQNVQIPVRESSSDAATVPPRERAPTAREQEGGGGGCPKDE
ncbi:hypothetical protein NDU88_000500 [Pleurodeles waltl]|uniref:Uncharacterized protein n=1 Tax=Pleurodeles waltl TaxID=8319 RepID=A0AAV7LXL2_PLEWA|nr:hypothetical protein NDU88_000500 [Pleurodeles waltl]